MNFGQLLQAARQKKRMILRKLANITGLSISYLSDMEHSRRKPPKMAYVKIIEKALEIDDGSLQMAAKKENDIAKEMKEFVMTRPQAAYAFLRAAENKTEEELNRMFKKIEELNSIEERSD